MRQKSDSANSDEKDGKTVFFSYSRVDQAKALPIIKAIEAAGFHVWWDGMLDGGTEFLRDTEDALESANAVVVLWSENSVGSHWVRDEATSGRDRKRLVPLTLDGTLPPLGFRQIQVIDMRGWESSDTTKHQLGKALAVLHDKPLTDIERFARRINRSRSGGISKRSVFLCAGALGVAAVVAGAISYRPESLLSDIVVLPFENLIGDEALSYISDGLASAIRDGLSMNEALRVTARSSSQEALKASQDAAQIAKLLKAENVLEGRLERLGDEQRMTVSLIKGQNGVVRWTEVYPFEESRVLALRDAVIQRVAQSLSLRGNPGVSGAGVEPAAYDEYMRGNALLNRGATLERVEAARDHFQRAVDLDPDFGLAYAALADQLLLLGAVNSDKQTSLTLIEAAYENAEKGVEVSPDLATTHVVLGHVRLSGRGDVAGATNAYTTAERLGLRRTIDIGRYAIFQAGIGNTDSAIRAARRGQALDPLNPMIQEVLAYSTYAAGNFQTAASLYRDVLALDEDRYTVRAWLGLSEIYSGNPERGLQICQNEQNEMERITCEAIAFANMGQIDEAIDRFDALVRQFGDAAAYQQAQIQAQLREFDAAMDTLRLAEELEDTGLSLLKIDPALNPLRDREDFSDLLKRRGMSR